MALISGSITTQNPPSIRLMQLGKAGKAGKAFGFACVIGKLHRFYAFELSRLLLRDGTERAGWVARATEEAS